MEVYMLLPFVHVAAADEIKIQGDSWSKNNCTHYESISYLKERNLVSQHLVNNNLHI